MVNKKLFKIFIYITMLTSFFFFKYSLKAFGGYTHYYIRSKVTCRDKYLKDLSEEEKVFKDQLIKVASQCNDTKLKLFALGWSDHVIQDNHTSEVFNKIFQNTKNYRIRYGKCDSYVYGKTGYLSSDVLFCPNTLIKSTYKQFKLNDTLPKIKNRIIKKETSKILKAFYAQSWLGFNSLSEDESKIAKYEFKNLELLCGSNNPDYEILFSND